MAVQEAKVPDIGNYTNVPVIEVLVKPGDTVSRDQGLVTLESDKATMEVPAPFDGVVKEVKVKVGDEIAEGTVVVAESQTHGRGRHGQPWFSPPGVNLYASALFRPSFLARDATSFSFVASLAVYDALRELGGEPSIKWPNDVILGGKKVAGTLVECATRGHEIDFLILGVGVNLNVDPAALRAALDGSGFAATSVSHVLGRTIERNAFAAS